MNPVGLIEGRGSVSGRRSPLLRAIAIVLLLVFTAAVVVTGTISLSRYCLTTDGGDLRALEPPRQRPSPPRR